LLPLAFTLSPILPEVLPSLPPSLLSSSEPQSFVSFLSSVVDAEDSPSVLLDLDLVPILSIFFVSFLPSLPFDFIYFQKFFALSSCRCFLVESSVEISYLSWNSVAFFASSSPESLTIDFNVSADESPDTKNFICISIFHQSVSSSFA